MATEKLPKTLKKNGNDYTQIKRGKNAFLYKLVDPEASEYPSYEVFTKKIQPPFSLRGKGKDGKLYEYPEKERFPGNEDFGKWAWAWMTLKSATNHFNELEKDANFKLATYR